LQKDSILDRRIRISCRGNVEYLHVGHKGTNPSKARWIDIRKVRELYPHLLSKLKWTFGGPKASCGEE